MASYLIVLALGLALTTPLASQVPAGKTELPRVMSDLDFARVGSLHGEAREVPVGVSIFKGVVPGIPERWSKVYAFTLAPKEAIRVKVVESSPKQAQLVGAIPENLIQSKNWTDPSVVTFQNTFEKPCLFYVLVRGGFEWEECQYTLSVERETAVEVRK